MHDLVAITALGGAAPRVDTVAGVTLTENPNLALCSVAARKGHGDACRAVLKKLLAAPAPEAGKAQLSHPIAAVWMGPEQWMLYAPFDTHEELAHQMADAFGATASTTEQTDGWACFDLSGDKVNDVMELLCNIDTRQMQTGDATRSAIHHLGCFVIRREASEGMRIIGPRSSAGSLHHAIHAAMISVL